MLKYLTIGSLLEERLMTIGKSTSKPAEGLIQRLLWATRLSMYLSLISTTLTVLAMSSLFFLLVNQDTWRLCTPPTV